MILSDGSSLAARLIEQGLAVQSAVTPNTRCAEDYAAIEQQARENKRGIWQRDDFWHLSFERLAKRARGFRIITDRVAAIRTFSSTVHLQLANGVVVILPTDMRLIDSDNNTLQPTELRNRLIEARGWVYRFRKQHFIKAMHPANLRIGNL